MVRPKILVVGATGKTGRAVVLELLSKGYTPRALVRNRDSRARDLAARGAEIVEGDLFDTRAIAGAASGAQRAYWCAPFDPQALKAAQLFAEAAQEAGLESIVGLSQWLASPAHPARTTRDAYAIDRLFEQLSPGVTYTCIEPGFFADNYLRLIDFASLLGVFPSLTGNSRNAPPSNEDIARCAVAALLNPAAHAGKRYRPTGPQLLSTGEMASIVGQVLGRSVRRVEMPMWLFLKAARLQKVPAYELSGFRYYVQDHLQGAFEHGAPTDHVESLTGRPPESFETIARRYAASPAAARTFGNVLKAWATFMVTPVAPGYDFASLDRLDNAQPTEGPRFAMADHDWLSRHTAVPVSLARHVL